jgi:predicted dehydrogenase
VERSIRVVVVGCGAVSRMLYGPALQVLEGTGDVKVVGLVDPAVPQRAEMKTIFPHAVTHSDLAQCPLGAGTLAIIASPPRFHAEQSIHALRQGAAVLCEKPMAASVPDAEAMLTAARETNGLLAVGVFRRFFPAFEALKSVFERKPFGELRRFSIQEGGKFAWSAASDSFFRRDMTMGGVYYDVGVYVVDALLWWMGDPVAFAYEDDAMGGVEANCRLTMTYPGDVRGTVRLSRDWQTRNRYVFEFERATVSYGGGDANHLTVTFDGVPFALGAELTAIATSPSGMTTELATRTNPQSFTEQLRNVVGAMRGTQVLRVPGEEGIRSLRFIAQCYAARRLMDMPWLSPEERTAAQRLAGRTA